MDLQVVSNQSEGEVTFSHVDNEQETFTVSLIDPSKNDEVLVEIRQRRRRILESETPSSVTATRARGLYGAVEMLIVGVEDAPFSDSDIVEQHVRECEEVLRTNAELDTEFMRDMKHVKDKVEQLVESVERESHDLWNIKRSIATIKTSCLKNEQSIDELSSTFLTFVVSQTNCSRLSLSNGILSEAIIFWPPFKGVDPPPDLLKSFLTFHDLCSIVPDAHDSQKLTELKRLVSFYSDPTICHTHELIRKVLRSKHTNANFERKYFLLVEFLLTSVLGLKYQLVRSSTSSRKLLVDIGLDVIPTLSDTISELAQQVEKLVESNKAGDIDACQLPQPELNHQLNHNISE